MLYIKRAFPIVGDLKEPLLILESLIVFFFLELAIIFWLRVRKQKHELKSLQEKAYIWLLIGYSLMWFFIIIADHFIENPSIRLIYLNIGFISLIFCTSLFMYIIEKNKIFIRKFLFTKLSLLLLSIYFVPF